MAVLARSVPQIPVVLVSLVLWGSFAWGLPADAPSTEGGAEVTAAEDTWRCGSCGAENVAAAKYCTECGAKRAEKADVVAEDPWAGVRISNAYDYAKCASCGKKNDLRVETCSRCGRGLPQPSAEVTDPGWVFVPGKGYYREGELLEPGKTRKGMLTAGFVLTATGVVAFLVMAAVAPALDDTGEGALFLIFPAIIAVGAIGLGVVLCIVGLSARRDPVYAFANGDGFEAYERPVFALRSPYYDNLGLKVEVTAFAF